MRGIDNHRHPRYLAACRQSGSRRHVSPSSSHTVQLFSRRTDEQRGAKFSCLDRKAAENLPTQPAQVVSHKLELVSSYFLLQFESGLRGWRLCVTCCVIQAGVDSLSVCYWMWYFVIWRIGNKLGESKYYVTIQCRLNII